MIQTRKRFGQHFLEPAWADKVVKAIAPGGDDTFLEIGPGTGILTLRLASKARHVTAVEIDRDLIAALVPKLPANASVVAGDVLEVDLAALVPDGPLRVAGNLPYNISSPILFRLLDLGQRRPVRDATLMLQREVADRIVAKPGSAEYGVLSILLQWNTTVTKLLVLPPGAFRPPPKVTSAVIRLSFHEPDVPVSDPQLFTRLVRSVFTHRRKTLSNALAPLAAELGVSPQAALRQAGLDPTRRPQTLEIVEIARLVDIFGAGVR
jgi:16S rRNA (adenine1518-N6/adenine1519-N6)-dimethyltransferase